MSKPDVTDLSFRAVIPGETAVARVIRILKHMADTLGSRALLEPGARTVDWTCMVSLRAALYHACLRPGDGWPIIEIGGQKFGKYVADGRTGLVDGVLRAWGGGGEEYFGSMGRELPDDGLPIADGCAFLTGGSHVGAVCYAFARGDGKWDLFTCEGGQAAIATAGTRTWVDDDSTPHGVREVVLTKAVVDDHEQRFVRTVRRAADGRWENMGPDGAPKPSPSFWGGVALLSAKEVITAPVMTPEERASVDAARAEQDRLNVLAAKLPRDVPRPVLPPPEE